MLNWFRNIIFPLSVLEIEILKSFCFGEEYFISRNPSAVLTHLNGTDYVDLKLNVADVQSMLDDLMDRGYVISYEDGFSLVKYDGYAQTCRNRCFELSKQGRRFIQRLRNRH